MRRFAFAIVIASCGGASPPAAGVPRAEANERIEAATAVVHALRSDFDGAIPHALAGSARCVAVVPDLIHAGLIIGARAGRGVVTCREKSPAPGARLWTKPAFFVLSGASAGLSAGVQSVDLVMLVMTGAGEGALLQGRLQVGADTAVVAGPFGRAAQATSDVAGAAIVYYSRARGAFVGLDLASTVLEADEESSRAFYGDARDFGGLLRSDPPAPPAAEAFRAEVERAF